jgi:hypothetical protein
MQQHSFAFSDRFAAGNFRLPINGILTL